MAKLAVLKDFKQKFDVEVENYLDKVILETKKRDSFMAEAVEYVKKMVMAGGKRLRPAFMYYGYLAAGGKEKSKILRASVGIELIHIFLLIHDDIMDQDGKRHGLDTLHTKYRKFGERIFKNKNCEHFGNSMAMIIGDMVGALGNQVIYESEFDPRLLMKALSKLQSIVSMTVIGQSQDFHIEFRGKATEKEVMSMYENKTAKYSIEGPLHLGAILSGAGEKNIQGLSKYAIPLGIAFQIQDDILGIFGSEEKLGKKVGADIIEGKQTLLVIKAKQKANEKQKKKMNFLLGKKDLKMDEARIFQDIIRETGALDYAKNLSQELVIKAKKELGTMKINAEAKNFLTEIADYMINREL